ncbi:MAG: hypothetical protein GW779_03575 [Candidatus Altiarchaeum hamiconexum]|uniref:Triphosphoribosyl-dephospho-CoA synthase n=1 Tax=Candidatus Altarchaeum hamiconexum TaxID=1803513 RepID=A0A8J7YUQ6_9ARCH|nr:hypothetical protein [Candidatus Altarchaeum hamiconexum]OIQ05953.1 MAG: hypothetical protein AUK59_01790 [Candidatus Altarchaeum sp. CG2_30_32_3053]PIV27367.1 MAG: hypothetical protein COS36_05955 [Candidatus Altarchaeum sp. CG03_land_8_20_14_0_80_32_618]PIX49500.1 MAG: hypothetical protein COZ53_00435 [Candidatus Altarchaeum sp. CG_4_8_14_3_um_filter_33_2054]PJC14007.1 MAG: hypothetical protein CO063_03265 [Candidatus Altarchaeum sp. CG_4_9_14_0_8_um_filter_32_206]
MNIIRQKARQTGNFARIVCILEASTEKPGNVTPTYNFIDTNFEDFVVGSIVIGDAVEDAFINGAGRKIELGKTIYECAKKMKIYNKTNTHFGISLLFIPIAIALGKNNFENLRDGIDDIVKNTNVDDAIYLHKAILLSNARVSDIKGDKFEKWDVLSKNFIDMVRKENITFYDLMKASSDKDLISRELITRMEISFKYASALYLCKRILRKDILSLFISVLSKFPDTLIAKKYGMKTSEDVSKMAADVLNENLSVGKFTHYLREHKINPGTTADLMANIVFLYLLERHLSKIK